MYDIRPLTSSVTSAYVVANINIDVSTSIFFVKGCIGLYIIDV